MLFTAPLPPSIPAVPFYSQFRDIEYPPWQKVGCGITSLAMIVDYYKSAVSVNILLQQATSSGAYDTKAGWTYKGLLHVAKKYGLDGASYDLAQVSTDDALSQFTQYVKDGPVMASVHYQFDPKSTIPHLVVVNGIIDGTIYYNDPAAQMGEQQISVANFLKGWKKRFIVIRPAKETVAIGSSTKQSAL